MRMLNTGKNGTGNKPLGFKRRVLHLLLLLGLPGAALQEIAPEQPTEEDDVHDGHDGHPHAAQRIGQQRYLVPVEHQPAGHPSQGVDAEDHVRAQVDDAVDAVERAGRHAGHAQDLAEVEEHGVYLHQQGHHGKSHVATRHHGEAEAGDHHDVMKEKLPGLTQLLAAHHVKEIIDEVTDGKRHQSM